MCEKIVWAKECVLRLIISLSIDVCLASSPLSDCKINMLIIFLSMLAQPVRGAECERRC